MQNFTEPQRWKKLLQYLIAVSGYCLRLGHQRVSFLLCVFHSTSRTKTVAFNTANSLCCKNQCCCPLNSRIGFRMKGFGMGRGNQTGILLTEEVSVEGSGLLGSTACRNECCVVPAK